MKSPFSARPIFLVILGLSAAMVTGCPQNGDPPGDIQGTLQSGGITRTYVLHVPNQLPSAPAPLVIALHGGGLSGAQMERTSGFNTPADRDGFFVVYPDGVNHAWNDGRLNANVDDVGFMKDLVGELASQYQIDTTQVFATGASDGGMMCQRLANEWTEGLAAVAPVIASIPENMASVWAPSMPIPILMINSTDDPFVPWDGGNVAYFGRGRVISILDTVAFWVQHDLCDPSPVTTWLPDIHPNDGTRVWKDQYTPIAGGAEVIFYGIQGGGHTWPGGPKNQLNFLLGKVSQDISATEIIWSFFKSHL